MDEMHKRHGASIKTYTGRYVYPLNPEPEDIDVLDIAHALSNQCRFSGHCREFYSVAQHSVLVSEQIETPDFALWGLFHDAAEAYLVDLPRPLKHAEGGFGDLYREAEERLMAVIAEALNLSGPEPQVVKFWDTVLLVTEQRDLMGGDKPWYSAHPLPTRIETCAPIWAKRRFLRRYYDLTGITVGEAA